MFETGKNTYVTLEQADNYINATYRQYHPLCAHWGVLNDEEKQAYLLQATQEIEWLKFIGKKAADGQAMQFPRILSNIITTSELPSGETTGSNTIPEVVLHAQVENALAIIKKECANVYKKQVQTLASQGVASSSITEQKDGSVKAPITSLRAYTMLREYLEV